MTGNELVFLRFSVKINARMVIKIPLYRSSSQMILDCALFVLLCVLCTLAYQKAKQNKTIFQW